MLTPKLPGLIPKSGHCGREVELLRGDPTVGCSGNGSSPLWTELLARSRAPRIRGTGETSSTSGDLYAEAPKLGGFPRFGSRFLT
jgi:hypothetical protein